MKLYKFNNQKLCFEEFHHKRITIPIICVIIAILMISSFKVVPHSSTKELSLEEKLIIIKEHNEFSEEKLRELIYSLNFKFPDIIFAQAKLESSYFKSTIFKENNNLFGMKEASSRASIAQGTNRGHAYYTTWQNSVIDYAFYYSTYLYKLRTKEEYYEYLRQNYAEDPNYINKIKKLTK